MTFTNPESNTLIDIDDPRPPCPHCEGRLEEHEDSAVDGKYCPTCGCAPDGSLAVRTDVAYHWYPYDRGRDESREKYRVSCRVVMYGAHPAIGGADTYDLDDGSASYKQFVSA